MHHAEHELHFNDYLDVIRKRKLVVFVFFLVMVFTVTIGSFMMKPVYRATTTLLIDVESPAMLMASDNVSIGAQNFYTYNE